MEAAPMQREAAPAHITAAYATGMNLFMKNQGNTNKL